MSNEDKKNAIADGAIPEYTDEFAYDGDAGLLESCGENSTDED